MECCFTYRYPWLRLWGFIRIDPDRTSLLVDRDHLELSTHRYLMLLGCEILTNDFDGDRHRARSRARYAGHTLDQFADLDRLKKFDLLGRRHHHIASGAPGAMW